MMTEEDDRRLITLLLQAADLHEAAVAAVAKAKTEQQTASQNLSQVERQLKDLIREGVYSRSFEVGHPDPSKRRVVTVQYGEGTVNWTIAELENVFTPGEETS